MLSIFFSTQFLFYFLAVIGFAVCILYFLLYLEKRHKKELFGNQGVSVNNFVKLVEELKSEIKILNSKAQVLENRQDNEEKKAKNYLQSIGFLRFNPFSDTGGQQSFILSILDKQKNGILISNLVGRSGIRWIVKKISGGESDELKLSEEERKVIGNAKSM